MNAVGMVKVTLVGMSDEFTPHQTVMLAAFEGWNDACRAATNAVRHLLAKYESREIRTIRCDGYYDYQVARPILCHVTGKRRIIWPHTSFYDITIDSHTHIYAQIAPEPNYRWRDYCRESLRIAEECDVDKIVTMGAMFADCPHTRPLPIDISDDYCKSDMDREYSGPVGIPTVLEEFAREEGFETTSMWVSIPQYLGSDECAQATLRMVEGLERVLGVTLYKSDLPQRAQAWRSQASVLTRCNDELAEYVHNLEREYDLKSQAKKVAELGAPVAEQLVKDAETYLKQLGL